ncbi:uncharacterized protein [Lolium perenne]|uniref:uncharacterized protein n=1 Tax=Lolium perenne TaxID=4522 RepID=UPI0021F576AB|nr:uncharacterized protein LOC127340463 [Lolium perenne]
MSMTRAKRHDRAHRSIMADWAELLPELVQGIADCVLSTTGGGEAYMNMRAVCSSWRSAVAKPSPLAAITDLRFRPRHWVMLDLPSKKEDDDADGCLFLHVLTGRFRFLRLPVLHDHILVGASDGLLVLGDRDQPPNLARVLNPLTGDMLHFAAPFHQPFSNLWSTAVSHSRLILWGYAMLAWAAPTSDEFTKEDIGKSTASMGAFHGNVYVVDLQRQLFKFISPAEQCDADVALIAQVPLNVDVYSDEDEEEEILFSYSLVESAGELLLIRPHGRALQVFIVDVERKSLQEVKSLGGCHALFLGPMRCMSVDAANLPSVDSDCIYLLHWVGKSEHMSVYSLRDDKMEFISSGDHPDRPFSLVQVLLRYCDFLDE